MYNFLKFFAVIIIFIIPTNSYAQTGLYNSEFCDFYAEFPSEINITKKCIPSNDKKTEICGETVSFIKNFASGSSIDIKISCNKITKETYERFSKEEILFTFESLINSNKDIKNYGISYSDFMVSKRAYSLASGVTGLSPLINIQYLWVGENSLMSMDAKLIGEESVEADEIFADITKSVKSKVLDVPAIDENEIMDKETSDEQTQTE